jgi:hypothetical protein
VGDPPLLLKKTTHAPSFTRSTRSPERQDGQDRGRQEEDHPARQVSASDAPACSRALCQLSASMQCAFSSSQAVWCAWLLAPAPPWESPQPRGYAGEVGARPVGECTAQALQAAGTIACADRARGARSTDTSGSASWTRKQSTLVRKLARPAAAWLQHDPAAARTRAGLLPHWTRRLGLILRGRSQGS